VLAFWSFALPFVPALAADETGAARIGAAIHGQRATDALALLSYNVHGLARIFAKDNPRDRTPTIGWLARSYDVVLFQEDFEYHALLREQLEDHVGIRGTGVGFDPRRLVAKILAAPFTLLLPNFSPPYGAGVSTFLRKERFVRGDIDRRAFGICGQWLGGSADCWANKGILRVGVRLGSGDVIDVYNTHLESGSERESVEMRRQQLDILASLIESTSRDRAVIVAGDFNADPSRQGDRNVLFAFRTRLGLQDSGAGPELAAWRERNYILFRDGARTWIEVEAAGEAREFVSGQRALSDHPALFALLRLQSETAEEVITP